MPLQFEVFNAESGVFSYPSETVHILYRRLGELAGDFESGAIGVKAYLAALNRLLAEGPDFLDIHVHIANHWHEQGKPKKALEAALAGLAVANRLIPEGFNGCIEWGHLENRGYLRTMYIAMVSHIRLRQHRTAVTFIELMLARNPNDNQGVRYLLGSEALQAGDYDKARAVLEADASGYPPYYYDLALCHMLRDDWVAAATALRKGFASNAYIAEMLGGADVPAPLAIWHSSNFEEPETAHEYLHVSGNLWLRQSEGIRFTRWLFNQSSVLAERAAIMACKEALLWEKDASARARIGKQQDQLVASIDDTLSAAVVVERENRQGKMGWPWTPDQA